MTNNAYQINPMALYAEGIDTSNYVATVAPLISQIVVEIGDLLDIGAGGGQLGFTLHSHGKQWVAIEPDPYMGSRLAAYPHCTKVIASGWEDIQQLSKQSFDTVLAANMIAPQANAIKFLELCRFWTRNAIVWVVPSQRGPRKLCLSGCLPEEWVDEGEETGYERVISQLPKQDYPQYTLIADWVFSYITKDIDKLATHMADRLDWDKTDSRRADIRNRLYEKAIQQGTDYYLQVPKQSTILIWTNQ